MKSGKVKNFFNKLWFLLWKDNSFKGWIFSLIFIFVFIKFLFFPFLSLVTGTSLPLAIVESCSMYHQGNVFSDFNSWFQRHELKYSELNITESQFHQFSLLNGFSKGDILFIVGVKPQNIRIGDVIIYNAGQQAPIIHRVINITKENGTYFFSTEGDNNNGQLSFENGINQNQILGKASFTIAPFIGWVKLVFYEGQKPADQRGFCTETPSS
ncbi:MAG: signal peptidase I [Candidatus Nanoarchaeia archaeon]